MRDLSGRQLSLRWRMVLLAAVAVTGILLLGGVVLSIGLRQILSNNAVDSGRVRARDLATLAVQGTLPAVINTTSDDEAFVQVIAAGRVLASSPNVDGEPPLDVPQPPPGVEMVRSGVALPMDDDDVFRVVSVGMTTPVGPGVVHVAIAAEQVTEAVAAAIRIGLIGLAPLVLLLSAAMWVVVGRTLRPIEAIRQEADAIGGDDLRRRVPEPAIQDEVGRLALTVNRMLSRIEDSAQRQRRFVGDAAHELRSPIASLRTQLETARGARRAVDWDDVSADLLDETLRMQRLTDQLLVLARLDAVGLGSHAVAVDLDELVVQAAAELRRTRPECHVELQGVQPVQLAGEPTLLGLVVRNLLDNAGRHAKGRVVICLGLVDGWAELVVDDDGPGIPAERRAELFGRFARLDEARDRQHGGAGLGLAIVADIVAGHGGTAEIDGAPGLGGARLTVRLPV